MMYPYVSIYVYITLCIYLYNNNNNKHLYSAFLRNNLVPTLTLSHYTYMYVNNISIYLSIYIRTKD